MDNQDWYEVDIEDPQEELIEALENLREALRQHPILKYMYNTVDHLARLMSAKLNR